VLRPSSGGVARHEAAGVEAEGLTEVVAGKGPQAGDVEGPEPVGVQTTAWRLQERSGVARNVTMAEMPVAV